MTRVERKLMPIIVAMMVFYVLALVGTILGTASGAIPDEWGWAAGAITAAPMLVVYYAFYRTMQTSDEFISTVLAKRLIITTLLMLSLILVVSFVQRFGKMPEISMFWITPAFWVAFTFVTMFVHSSRIASTSDTE